MTDYITGLYAAFGAVMALMAREQDRARPVHRRRALRMRVQLHGAVDPGASRSSATSPTAPARACPSSTPNNLYPTGDGSYIHITAMGDSRVPPPAPRRWASRELADDPRFADAIARAEQPRRARRRSSRDWTSAHAARRARSACSQSAGVPATRIFTIADIFDDPHYRARGIDRRGARRRARHASRWPAWCRACRDTPGAVRHAGRRVGQDTRAVLRELLGLTTRASMRCRPASPASSRSIATNRSASDPPQASQPTRIRRSRRSPSARRKALAMGGPAKLARAQGRRRAQRARAHRLPARPGHLHRVGPVRHLGVSPADATRSPADGKIAGFGRIDGRDVARRRPTTSP